MTCYPCIRCNECNAYSLQLALVCSECGTPIPVGASECPECGCTKFDAGKIPPLPDNLRGPSVEQETRADN